MKHPTIERVICIGFGNNGNGQDVYNICSHHIPELSEDFIIHTKEIQDKLSYFKKPTVSHSKAFRNEDFKGFGFW